MNTALQNSQNKNMSHEHINKNRTGEKYLEEGQQNRQTGKIEMIELSNLPMDPIRHIMERVANRASISLSSFLSNVLLFEGIFMEFIITYKYDPNQISRPSNNKE